jgi:hypothetical protein
LTFHQTTEIGIRTIFYKVNKLRYDRRQVDRAATTATLGEDFVNELLVSSGLGQIKRGQT